MYDNVIIELNFNYYIYFFNYNKGKILQIKQSFNL